jgi:hypothetical protein
MINKRKKIFVVSSIKKWTAEARDVVESIFMTEYVKKSARRVKICMVIPFIQLDV